MQVSGQEAQVAETRDMVTKVQLEVDAEMDKATAQYRKARVTLCCELPVLLPVPVVHIT